MANTVAEAQAQILHVPEYDLPGLAAFFRFALSLNGYHVAEELGEDAFDVFARLQQDYLASGEWRGSLLELRIALFCQARRLHHWGSGADADDIVRENRGLLEAVKAAAVGAEGDR